MIVVLFGQPHSGKTTLAQELEFEDVPDPNQKQFKIDISGMDFIFLLDE